MIKVGIFRKVLEKAPLILNDDFSEILTLLENTNENYFITGRAGTGKSTLLQVFRKTTRKRVAFLAPTGIAALNIRGQTIHSFFGFPPRMIGRDEIKRVAKHRIYELLEMIIIDEISMVRADILDNMDYFLRINRRVDQAFGGVQMVFFGDLFQLPPVVAGNFEKHYFTNHYKSPFFFSAKIFDKGFRVKMLELHQVYRQDERHFIKILDQIRTGDVDEYLLEDINTRYLPIPELTDYYITLCSINATASSINLAKLRQLNRSFVNYQAKITGEFNAQNYPTDVVIRLCEGAQVMFIKNDPNKQYVNGTIGIVKRCSQKELIVEILDKNNNKTLVSVEEQNWEIIRYNVHPDKPSSIVAETIGVFTQIPLKLAWAITIHKSQGKTFEKVILNLGSGAFESGQCYVALSRCRTLNGILLTRPILYRDVIVSDQVLEYYEWQRRSS